MAESKGPLAVGNFVLVPNGFRDMKKVPVIEAEDHPLAPGVKQVVVASGPGTGRVRFVWNYGPTAKGPGEGKDSKGRKILRA